MAKKIITPEEYKSKREKKAAKRKRFYEVFLMTLSFALAIALVFAVTTVAFTRVEKRALRDKIISTNGGLTDSADNGYDNSGSTDFGNADNSGSANSDNQSNTSNSGSTSSGNTNNSGNTGSANNTGNTGSANNTGNTGSGNNTGNTGSGNNTGNTGSANNTGNTGSANNTGNTNNAGNTNGGGDNANNNGGSSAKDAEYFDLFVKAFKGVKTNAKSATLVKKNAYNYKDHIKANKIIEAAAAPLLSSLLKAEEVNETYTDADIATKFPPSGTTCGLTQNDVKKITCKEEGNYYIIEVIVKGSKNPEAGKSVGSVASIITKQSIQDPIKNIPAINSLEPTCDYHDTTARAKIEKSTGNCVEYYCQLPMILIMSNDKNAYEIGLGFEEWWTIAY